jgi:methionine synthase II (cobalamin-independent)
VSIPNAPDGRVAEGVSRPHVPRGAFTSIGSLPGTDPLEAAKLVVGELPLLPHIAELPGRGAGADMIGRTASLLVDMPVQLVPTGWRLASHPGHDLTRAHDFLAWDIDAIEQAAAGHTGALKLQVAGPWTLAASIELPSGHRVVSDHGATRDLAESLAEGLRAHIEDVARRLPHARLVVQFDEPALPAVLTGSLPTASGWGTLRAVDRAVVRSTLASVLEAARTAASVVELASSAVSNPVPTAVHCCANDVPVQLIREAGADAISLDLIAVGGRLNDLLGEAVDADISLWLGVLPALSGTGAPLFEQGRQRLERFWNELGFPRSQMADGVVVTPSCGLAGAEPSYARRVLAALRDLGGWMTEEDDEVN